MRKPPQKTGARGATRPTIVTKNSGGASGLNTQSLVNQVNSWRERYNPLRGLNIQKAVSLMEAAQQGLMADLQWTYEFIEGTDPTLLALVERRIAALVKLDVNYKRLPDDELPAGATSTMADDQAAYLRDCYEQIENLGEAIEALEMSKFRGFTHLEKIYANPGTSDFTVSKLEFVEQWHWTRKSRYSPWLYNAAANQSNIGIEIDPKQFIILESKRPIDRIALIKHVRSGLSEKDWDAFIEIYGIPGWLVIGPPGLQPGSPQEAAFKAAAETIARGGSGALPNGSQVECADSPRANAPFRPRLDYLNEQLVLAGTGGLLTMLAMTTGIGKGPTDAHADAFESIAQARARIHSETFQKQFDAEQLDAKFPGQPHCAYMELAANEETEVGDVVDQILKLAQAGYEVDEDEVSERTGYTVTKSEMQPPPDLSTNGKPLPMRGSKPIKNRASAKFATDPQIIETALQRLRAIDAEELKPLMERVHGIIELEDPQLFNRALKTLQDDLRNPNSDLVRSVMRSPAAAQAMADAMTASAFNGMAEANTK